MKPHHAAPGQSDEWFTPPEIFEALGVTFDLDVAQPETGRAFLSVPCRRFLTVSDNGLTAPWNGFVWMNPPFGGRNGVVPWMRRFMEHGNGIACVNALTSSGWFHEFVPHADALLFPRGKTKFIRPDGTRGNSPGNGVVLIGVGMQAVEALAYAHRKGFGLNTMIVDGEAA
ncbi:phage N-6-adenine-methyltransferase [Komagataeibacter sp. FNDCF1]|uniref:phage N-6-adenine-methyltransferase n=1 Tax=Komagataeibacter sp. FNDCF1 TaxID=2878681 RepID=UPI001E306A36|nr:phage N-6-adenine-methyltransferase [Komagataeibacter sp. FNDCF1]MCE2563338.1 phage N-6-adenine-methyltransferase [Komagataeibacter sp. FNDCF1]